MDGSSNAAAPPAYQEVQWLADVFVALMGLGWVVNYALMIWHSRQGKTYSMALIPLCNNIGWEMVYVLVYPSKNTVELVVFAAGVTLNVFIMLAAARSARVEWKRSPLVANNAHIILIGGTGVCFAGHVALAMEIGPGLAYSWGAVICQILLSVGGICQLLQRNSSRGTSWILWFSRFFGSCCTVCFAFLRWKYWPEMYGWLNSPLVLWSLATFVLADSSYGLCLYLITREEKRTVKAE